MSAAELTVPRKLRLGDTIRVVAPARSRALVAEHDHRRVIDAHFAELGLRLTFGEHVDERDDFDSSSVASRVADLHAAFFDPDVAGILTVIRRHRPQPGILADRLSRSPGPCCLTVALS